MIEARNLEIVKYPSIILTNKSVPIEITENVKQVAFRMLELAKLHNGIGLAANQVGLAWRLFVMRLYKTPKICINPEIINGFVPIKAKEGCLSEPGISVEVIRNRFIFIRYTDIDGKKIEEHMRDLEARCAQHEIDHLDGILISSYL